MRNQHLQLISKEPPTATLSLEACRPHNLTD